MTMTGSAVFWILLAMAAAAVVTYFGRLFDLRRAQIDYQDFLKGVINILDAGNVNEALAVCEDAAAPLANVIATAIRSRKMPESVLRDAVNSHGRVEAARLDRRLAALAIIGQTAPLIGLFGTVVGFIRTVKLVDSSELVVRAELLEASMESLVCTALGLAVAIVVSIMYCSLRVRLERTVIELEAAASQIVGYLSGRGGKESAA
ncbi:MAG: MotA/TolQ/ExbB proton channel family protein [Kiritimatiellae bacterium]|nr:MotA/TolQ/ExbB proton channel family protein [Kiritimatiellia bacterium]